MNRSKESNTEERLRRLEEKLDDINENNPIYVEKSSDIKTTFFRDGVRTIDFILVYERLHKNLHKLDRYIKNLEALGLEFEYEEGVLDRNHVFIKVHGPYKLLMETAYINNVDLMFESDNDLPYKQYPNWSFFHTILTKSVVNTRSTVYKRARESVGRHKATDITQAERILLVVSILSKAKYGKHSYEFGLDSLTRNGYLLAAYPIHDSPFRWPQYGKISDRQLLAKYWGRIKCLFKVQPYDLIQKYYGTEVAFYFSFFGFYNRFLIFPSIIGLIAFIYGCVTVSTNTLNYRSHELCDKFGNLEMCPTCLTLSFCRYNKFSFYCMISRASYLLDNVATFAYAFLIPFWARMFVESWLVRQSELIYKWNVMSVEMDVSMRPNYPAATKYRRISKMSGIVEPYVPISRKICYQCVSFISIGFLATLILSTVVLVVMTRLFVKITLASHVSETSILYKRSHLIAQITGSIVGLLIMVMFEKICTNISRLLTDLENPRTQAEYDSSYIYKQFLVGSLNSFGQLYYIAFIKGRLTSYPGDSAQYIGMGVLNTDQCAPTGCIFDTATHLMVLLVGKSAFRSIMEIGKPALFSYLKSLARKRDILTKDLSLWEEAYLEQKLNRYYLLFDYRDIIMQYGYIVLFASAFPLAPIIAMTYNLIEIRIDAIKLSRQFRRPIPVRCNGIQAWYGILKIITIIGISTNVFFIAFQTELVPFLIKMIGSQYYETTFINYTLSQFAIKDFGKEFSDDFKTGRENNTCYYIGNREGPNAPNKYQLSRVHYHRMATRLIFIFILESALFGFTGLLSYVYPKTSRRVKERIIHSERIKQKFHD